MPTFASGSVEEPGAISYNPIYQPNASTTKENQ